MRILISGLVFLALFSQAVRAQTEQQLRTMPSSAEILELINKAEEKVNSFEKVLNTGSPYLDKDTFQQDQIAASNAHAIIATIRKNGDSLYSLIGLLSALDDLTLNGSRASRQIIVGITQDSFKDIHSANSPASVAISFVTAENSLYDISDLLLHVTLRYAAAEDDLMKRIADKIK